MENNLVIKNGLYRHFKGNYYIVEKLANMHDDPDHITPYVVYTSVKNGHTCLRKLSDFFADVSQREDNVTGQKQRFEVAVEVTGVLSLIDTQTILAEVEKRPDNPYEGCIKLEDVITKLDLLYMTRVQRERFFNEEDYVRLKDSYILNLEKLENAKEDLTIMHPLPRVNEISVEVDDDPRACYFFQALCGKHIRMALILFLLGIEK